MLYPVELRALTTRCIAVAGNRMQTRKVDRTRVSVNPTASVAMKRALTRHREKNAPGNRRGQPYGRYKTRTCDLHDVNVAL